MTDLLADYTAAELPLPSGQHLSYDDCLDLEDKRNYQNCSVIPRLIVSHPHMQ